MVFSLLFGIWTRFQLLTILKRIRKIRFGGKTIFYVFAEKFCFVVLVGILFLRFGQKTKFCGLAKELNFVVWQKKT